jgi:3-deoxy-7-phosphoheptulonate synthase / chorismate mutase
MNVKNNKYAKIDMQYCINYTELNMKMNEDINLLRDKIDKIDSAIIELLSERKRISELLIKSKKTKNLPVEDLNRENEIISKLQANSNNYLQAEFVSNLYSMIFKNSKSQFIENKKKYSQLYNEIKSGKTIISGPCAVESKESIFEIAEELSKVGIIYLRGGAFKPRTSPNSFQGLGDPAVAYMRSAANKFDMRTVIEITSENQLYSNYDKIDILQIGSRNMANFELLKSIASFSSEDKKPILLKRGFSATINEFLMAAEYLKNYGNDSIILCLRGIRTFEQMDSDFRFTPDLASILELKTKSNYPIFFDPSHSAGDSKYVLQLAKSAFGLGADGIIIETHTSPEFALSDAGQCLHPKILIDLIKNINK